MVLSTFALSLQFFYLDDENGEVEILIFSLWLDIRIVSLLLSDFGKAFLCVCVFIMFSVISFLFSDVFVTI